MTDSDAHATEPPDHFPCARLIKEIGRGPNGARALPYDDAFALYRAMLDGHVSDVELGAVLIAYRLKGETADELAAMLAAAHASFEPLHVQDAMFRTVSIPSYNGARRQPNLVPLLALLLAREGVPVLVHGVTEDPGRVTSAEIFAELAIAPGSTHDEIEDTLAERRAAFAPIEVLAPKLARLLALRRVLGVRNSTHTIVKLLQPFEPAGLRLVNYTHPPYRDSLVELFRGHPAAAAGGACSRAAPKARRWPTPAARCRWTGCTTGIARRSSSRRAHRRTRRPSSCPRRATPRRRPPGPIP